MTDTEKDVILVKMCVRVMLKIELISYKRASWVVQMFLFAEWTLADKQPETRFCQQLQ